MCASPVSLSSGGKRPQPILAADACDAYLHILHARFAPANACAQTATGMAWAHYGRLQERLGSRRAVNVQTTQYDFDNACRLDASACIHSRARSVAVVASDISDAELERLDQGGVRGLLSSLCNSGNSNALASWDTLATVETRNAELGCNFQLYAATDVLIAHELLIASLPTPLVIDHIWHLPPQAVLTQPAAQLVRLRLEGGNAWITLSAACLNSDRLRTNLGSAHHLVSRRRPVCSGAATGRTLPSRTSLKMRNWPTS